MTNIPCIPVPSPQHIGANFFPDGKVAVPSFQAVWSAQMLLTPFGGLSKSPLTPSDQLVVAHLTYDASNPNNRYMRVGMYLLETLQYYDFLFRTSATGSKWWWLISNPASPDSLPTQSFGPFVTSAEVPAESFLSQNQFSHAGTWKVLGQIRNAFSARKAAGAATWYWFEPKASSLSRIMNIESRNDFRVAILGAYYFVDVTELKSLATSNLDRVFSACSTATPVLTSPSPMVTLDDILRAMATPPSGSQIQCTAQQIEALVPGLRFPAEAVQPPSWTSKVQSECIMIGRDVYPYYCQLWYDWNRGTQVTVFVKQDEAGNYSNRYDEILPKGHVGPGLGYVWKGSQWEPVCCVANGSIVAMPVPNFIESGGGRCRAVISSSAYFGTISIWSVGLRNDAGDWDSDFWFWFDAGQKQARFSLAPPHSLTLIDYQTFVQNGQIDDCILVDPCNSLPPCVGVSLMALEPRPRFPGFAQS